MGDDEEDGPPEEEWPGPPEEEWLKDGPEGPGPPEEEWLGDGPPEKEWPGEEEEEVQWSSGPVVQSSSAWAEEVLEIEEDQEDEDEVTQVVPREVRLVPEKKAMPKPNFHFRVFSAGLAELKDKRDYSSFDIVIPMHGFHDPRRETSHMGTHPKIQLNLTQHDKFAPVLTLCFHMSNIV